MTTQKSVATIIGPWSGTIESGLLQRCFESWGTPLSELSDYMVATFLMQRIALYDLMSEAERRLLNAERDDTELYDGQLQAAFDDAKSSNQALQRIASAPAELARSAYGTTHHFH